MLLMICSNLVLFINMFWLCLYFLWHARLRFLNFKFLKFMSKHDIIYISMMIWIKWCINWKWWIFLSVYSSLWGICHNTPKCSPLYILINGLVKRENSIWYGECHKLECNQLSFYLINGNKFCLVYVMCIIEFHLKGISYEALIYLVKGNKSVILIKYPWYSLREVILKF